MYFALQVYDITLRCKLILMTSQDVLTSTTSGVLLADVSGVLGEELVEAVLGVPVVTAQGVVKATLAVITQHHHVLDSLVTLCNIVTMLTSNTENK